MTSFRVGFAALGALVAVGVSSAAEAAPQLGYVCTQLVATQRGPQCLKWAQSDKTLPPPPFMQQVSQPQAAMAPAKGKKQKKKNRQTRQ